ncbi:type II RES/Xre toxin-antitoxin system antitoxin [Bordetella genomosp. 12]|uniref:Uncharacterized protein n=1 Tax=Bordetella genomosp. 12 TaxID=463035 RepID=A0A261VNY4_9BORD|nr:antitoxin Xre/MbcA/ParS toxin-binding domain-containing protein [Bordetella genomosp. 12]OZI74913.1 hypothetical protein CAL22_10825 [Bordetella genomosp. 12]
MSIALASTTEHPARRRAGRAAPKTFLALIDADLPHLAHEVGRGLATTLVDDAADFLQVSKAEIMAITEVKAASLSRWHREGQPLPMGESDRLARVARVTRLARQLLGSVEDAVQWLNTPVPALGHQRPLTLLTSDAGSRMVEDTLARAAAGVLA